jgi:hypothetical protein
VRNVKVGLALAGVVVTSFALGYSYGEPHGRMPGGFLLAWLIIAAAQMALTFIRK